MPQPLPYRHSPKGGRPNPDHKWGPGRRLEPVHETYESSDMEQPRGRAPRPNSRQLEEKLADADQEINRLHDVRP